MARGDIARDGRRSETPVPHGRRLSNLALQAAVVGAQSSSRAYRSSRADARMPPPPPPHRQSFGEPVLPAEPSRRLLQHAHARGAPRVAHSAATPRHRRAELDSQDKRLPQRVWRPRGRRPGAFTPRQGGCKQDRGLGRGRSHVRRRRHLQLRATRCCAMAEQLASVRRSACPKSGGRSARHAAAWQQGMTPPRMVDVPVSWPHLQSLKRVTDHPSASHAQAIGHTPARPRPKKLLRE